MTGAGFRRLALSLPDAEEGSHMGHPDFRVAGKIFATLTDATERRGMVKLTPAEQREFVKGDPEAFSPAQGTWGKRGCTYIALGEVDRATLKKALIRAWCNTAPERMAEAFGEL